MYGKTGVGKTRTAYDLALRLETPGKLPYIKSRYDRQNVNWYCGYDQNLVLILDDVRISFFKDISNVLQLLDRYPVTLPQKYGSRQLVAKYIFITSPNKPESYVQDEDEDERKSNIEQLLRRIDHVYEVTNVNGEILFSSNSVSIIISYQRKVCKQFPL